MTANNQQASNTNQLYLVTVSVLTFFIPVVGSAVEHLVIFVVLVWYFFSAV